MLCFSMYAGSVSLFFGHKTTINMIFIYTMVIRMLFFHNQWGFFFVVDVVVVVRIIIYVAVA